MRTFLSFASAAALSLSALLGGCAAEDAVTGDEQFDEVGPAFAYDEYTVLFTNPVCRDYVYGPEQEVVSVSGERLTQKPRGAWCTKADTAASAARPESPQSKLVSWIEDGAVEEITMAYFTMSNAAVADALCRAIEERDVKVTLFLDKNSDLSRANQVAACQPQSGDPARAPRLLLRGGDGNLGLQHNKIFAINPNSAAPRFVFSSGNMTSGVVLHHENWHFIAAHGDTYFAEAHRCLFEGLEDHATSKTDYISFIKSCRAAIDATEERDMKAFFIPGEGDRAFMAMQKGIRGAEAIDLAVHRFTYKGLVRELDARLSAGIPVRFVADDDLYWAKQGQIVGGNDAVDVGKVDQLLAKGLDARYVETNHVDHLLHHNKFIIMDRPGDDADAVFAGSGNFTGAGFSDNFENYYFVAVPSVAEAFKAQYEHLYGTLATAPENMPTTLVAPSGG